MALASDYDRAQFFRAQAALVCVPALVPNEAAQAKKYAEKSTNYGWSAIPFIFRPGSADLGAARQQRAAERHGGKSIVVFAVSRDVTHFLLDTELLFEEFVRRVSRLAVPAFAFVTFYSLLIIVLAALYAALDRVRGGANFRIDSMLRRLRPHLRTSNSRQR